MGFQAAIQGIHSARTGGMPTGLHQQDTVEVLEHGETLSCAPCVQVLDAPQLEDDYYLNLVSSDGCNTHLQAEVTHYRLLP